MGAYKAVKRKIEYPISSALSDFASDAERDKTFLYILRETLAEVIKVDQVKGKLPRDKDFKFRAFMVDGSLLFESYDVVLNAYLGEGDREKTGSWEVGPKGKVKRKRRAVQTKQGWRMVEGPSRYARVPIRINDKSGKMVWRMAPLTLGNGATKRWVHPGINKTNFIDRAIDLAKQVFFSNQVARRRALSQVKGSSITMR